ncbi:MAG: outer membrane beta-barrel protein [Halioglobus sp.]
MTRYKYKERFPKLAGQFLVALAALGGFSSAGALAQPDEWSCFVGANAGYAALDDSFSTKEGEVALLFDPSDDGAAFGLGAGCSLTKRWFVSAEYQRTDADEITLDNWLGSINYGWSVGAAGQFYLGAIAGWSILEWGKEPVDTLENDSESEQAAYGAQIGYTHQLSDAWRLNFRYMYLSLDHRTRLQPVSGTARYSHDSQQGLTLGIDWQF